MASELDPWDNVEAPQSRNLEVLRRVGSENEIDFYHGKLFSGRYFLRLLVDGQAPPTVTIAKLRDIEIALHSNPDRTELTITLIREDSLEVFRAFCADLVSSTRFLTRTESARALPTVLARIHKWQSLFTRGQSGVLSASEQLGLFGELIVLRDVFLTRVDPFSALSAWQGPMGAEQDFQFQEWLFEVKSQMVTSDKQLHISSEHQLDIVSGNIALFHQVFATSEQPEARTLLALANEVRLTILRISPHAANLLDARLIQVGYEPLPDYDLENLLLTSRNAYEVKADFPRVCASDLSPGLSHVRYRLSLEACSPFRIEAQELLSRAFHARQ